MKIHRVVGVLAIAGSVALPGCWFFDVGYGDAPYADDGYSDVPNEIPPPYNDGTLLVDWSTQEGDMGEIRGYASDAVATNATYYGTGASVRLDSLGDDWWVMSYVTVDGIDIASAPAGTYRNNELYGSSTLYISVTGCSGPRYGEYTYDSASNDAEVTIADNADGSRTLSFRAMIPAQGYEGTDVAEGTITYRQGEVAPAPSYSTIGIVATDAVQRGDMGEIRAYEGAAVASEGYYYGSSSSLRLDSIGEGWWVMSYLNINNLDLATAPAGTYQSISTVYSEDEPQISVTGCSGPVRDNYTYDASSEEVELVIADNDDGTRTLNVTARFVAYDGTPQVATATFRYSIAQPID